MTSMMPMLVQDFVYQNVDEKPKATELHERIRSWVRHKVAMSDGPSPMDVGNVGNGEDEHDGEQHWNNYGQEEEYVQGVRASMQSH